jgi:transketolase
MSLQACTKKGAMKNLSWRDWGGEAGDIIGITRFGASAPAKQVLKPYGFPVENVVIRTRRLIEAAVAVEENLA